MRTFIWFCYFWFALVALHPQMRRAQRAEREGNTALRDTIVDREVANWARQLLRLAGVRVTVTGRENIPTDQAVVYVCNHQGYFDIPVLLTHLDRPHGLVAKDAVKKLPLVRDWMQLLGCIFIDRNNARQSVTALGDAARWLREDGRSFIIFPEGTRNKGGELLEFKHGAFKIALKAGAAIVPICIDGTYRVMEARHNWIGPAAVRLTILPPVATCDLSREEGKAIGEKIKQQIEQELAKNAHR